MAAFVLKINGQNHQIDIDPNTPLLWAIRDGAGLTGTKYGCGVAQCGACTVYIDGQTVRSCSLPISAVGAREVTTIEGLNSKEGAAVQKAWVALDVPQCGYCQSGQIMSAASLLSKKAQPSDADIDEAMRGNICRCGTYGHIRAAIHRAAELKAQGGKA